jgi:cysteinyl-tRNA synthetase
MLVHYRQPLEFSFAALDAAQNALNNLYERLRSMEGKPKIGCAEFEEKFHQAINDDLNMPQALAVMWELIKSDCPNRAKKRSLYKFDEVLGLDMETIANEEIDIPQKVKLLITERKRAREKKNWTKSDELRIKIENLGFILEDSSGDTSIKKKKIK